MEAVMMSVAICTIWMPQTLDTNGTVRLARGFASSTYTVSPSMAYWMFIRPDTCMASAMRRVYSLMVARCASEMFTDGRMQAESPEWMPASSMCSMTAGTNACWPSQIASASHSIAWRRKRSMRMGRSGVTPTAAFM